MVRNFLKTLLRITRKEASYSWTNILGFSLGIATAFIIALYGLLEISYDRYHSKADRIVRVTEKIRTTGVGQPSASIPIPAGPVLKEDYPHLVSSSVRLFRLESPLMFEYQQSKFNEQNVLFSDPSLFDVFDIIVTQGNVAKALTDPNQIVITTSLAKRYFNSTDAVGKVIRYDDKLDLKVTAVIEEIPTTSHFQADAFISFSTLTSLLTERQITSWFWNPAYTYLLLNNQDSRQALEAQLDTFMKKYFNETKFQNKFLSLQSLPTIHLTSSFDNELAPVGSSMYLNIIVLVGILILLLVVVNFVNMATARAMHRAKEIGIRKVLGSFRSQIMWQFLAESLLFTFIATAIGVAFALATLNWVNEYLGLRITLQPVHSILFYSLIPVVVVVGLLAGTYPAIYLSGFKPAQVLKGKFANSAQGTFIRRILVTGQFVITITLIVASVVVGNQFEFIRNKDLGFDRDNVIIVPVQRSAVGQLGNFRKFKERLENENGIEGVTAFEDIVGKGHNSGSYTPEGTSEPVLYPRLFVREDFTETLGIEVLAGSSFTADYKPSPDSRDVMINQSMVKALGWGSPEEALGKKMGEIQLDSGSLEVRVLGVVRDFNCVSLHSNVGPLVLEPPPTNDAVNLFMIKYIGVRVEAGMLKENLATIEKHWNDLSGGKIFEYSMLEEELSRTYATENTLSRMNNAFSLLAIVVSCLGLFGLASFILDQRTKEVSIRKVLGSTVSQIAVLLCSYFAKILLMASLIAIPLAYFSLDAWLDNFAYRIDLSIIHFCTATSLVFIIALLTIGYKTINTSRINPAKTLRND